MLTGESWPTWTFAELIAGGRLLVSDGYRAKIEELGGDGLIFLRAGHLNESHIDLAGVERFRVEDEARLRTKVSQPGDVLVTTKGNSTGRVGFVTSNLPPFVYSPHLSFWRSLQPDKLVPGFLRAWSRGPEFQRQLRALSHGTDMAPYLSLVDQKRLRITLPPPEKQRAIAHVLGTLDDKIELNRRMNRTLEEMVRALFTSWFVDFDPVRAKAAGRQPEGMDAATAGLVPDDFTESSIGQVPAGWHLGSILEIAQLRSGGTPRTDRVEYWNGPIAWASAKDVSQCGDAILDDTERSITKQGLDESSTQLIRPLSTVIVARGATTGRMVMLGREMAMNQTCYALESGIGTPLTLYCQLREEVGGLVHAAHGSVFDTITTQTFATSKIVLAPEPVLQAFERCVSPVFDRILSNIREIRTLTVLRDLLLPRLLSGEVSVAEAGGMVGGVG